VLTCPEMRVFPFVCGVLALALVACGGAQSADHQSEWRDVLRHKRAAVAPDATPEHKQVYADSVRAFVEKHPDHGRAREVWGMLQLEFADQLADAGRYQDAIRFYRAVLTHHPESEQARRGLTTAADRLAITREKLLELEKGMTYRQVASLLGKPIPGWSARHRRDGTTFEAWYYRARSGSIAGVYFRNGKVFAAEEESNARLGRLGS
jgi:hypothetical protein